MFTLRAAATVVLILTAMGCRNGGDRPLGGNFYLVDSNDAHVYLTKRSGNKSSIVIDQQIVDYRVVNHHILVRRKIARSFDCYDKSGVPTPITHYTDQDEYWVIDVNKETEDGPLREETYLSRLKDLGLQPVKLAIRYYFVPNTDAFNKSRAECRKLVPI